MFAYCQKDEIKLHRITLPSKSYPSTAPYAQLNLHFKKLLKDGILTRFIVRALLYPQYLKDIDTTDVILRRRHKTTLRMYRKGSDSSLEDENSNSESTTSCCSDGSTETNPFGEIKYYTGKKSDEENTTEYESIICDDQLNIDCTKKIFDEVIKKRCRSSVSIDYDSDGSFFILKNELRDSMPIRSKVVQLQDTKTPSSESIVHTSSARLNIGQLKQICSESQVSSFEHRITGAHMACEDLFNLDDNIKVKNILAKKSLLEERHSMPTQFVGNRFNNSSMTKVYIPSWKDKTDNQIISNHESTANSSTTHSSSFDFPINQTVIPVPDSIQTDLLYNSFNNNTNNDEEVEEDDDDDLDDLDDDDDNIEIIKPPSMFDNRLRLSKEISPFSKHSLNSDLRLSNIKKSDDSSTKRQSDVRRCISYQYVRMNNNISKTYDQMHSPRSSDSGMAGSCTIASPDAPKNSDDFFYPFEFDQTNDDDDNKNNKSKTGGLVHSRSSHNLGQFELFKSNENDFTDSGQYGDNSLIKDNMFDLSTSCDTVKRESARCRSEESLHEIIETNQIDYFPKLYRTGLYAHWWKKEKLPNSMIRELILLRKKNNDVNILEGSGKKFYLLLE